jgi:hypothetical protein
MNPNDPNVLLLERAAEPLGEALLEQLVFVGGAVAGVLITDPAMPEIRPTQDVDVICSVIARADYHQLGRQVHNSLRSCRRIKPASSAYRICWRPCGRSPLWLSLDLQLGVAGGQIQLPAELPLRQKTDHSAAGVGDGDVQVDRRGLSRTGQAQLGQ